MVTVPSHLRSMSGGAEDVSSNRLPKLRAFDIGGEALGADVVNAWASGRELNNMYGPTECTVNCVTCRMQPGEEITIGHCLPTYTGYVLDCETFTMQESGSPGLLAIAGIGVGRGYLNDQQKTEAKFRSLPGLGRVYDSGDLVAVGDQGKFLFKGRVDFQIKLRGQRIELEALEESLRLLPGVCFCEARAVDDGQKLALIASGDSLDAKTLQGAAKKLGNACTLNVVKIVDDSVWKFSAAGKLVRNHVPLDENGDAAVPRAKLAVFWTRMA